MGKKYLETKNNSLESSILGVWKTAIEEGDDREASVMDGRTKAYKSHRAKLEAARQRRESKKTVKEEYFEDTLYEWVFDLDDKDFNDILESMSDEEILAFDEGIGGWLAKKAAGAIKKRIPGSQARKAHLQKKASDIATKTQTKKDIATAKVDIQKAKAAEKQRKADVKQAKADKKAAKKAGDDDTTGGGETQTPPATGGDDDEKKTPVATGGDDDD